MHDQEQAKLAVLQFASRIFLAADNEDRAGQATKKTGRLFLVASQFLEVVRVFGELPEELEERIRYAKWKAADIVRALNEGRQPHPGPMGSREDEEQRQQPQPPNSTARAEPAKPPSPPIEQPTQRADSPDQGTLPSLSGQFSPPAPTSMARPPPTMPAPVTIGSPPPPPPASAPSPVGPPVSPVLDPMVLSVAEKHARYAVSAIQFEDVSTAIANLQQCLDILRGLSSTKSKGA